MKNPIMKEQILTLIGAAQAAKVERRAAARGIDDIWTLAMERAREELGLLATDGDMTRRAAQRAQQLAGCIPRFAVDADAFPPQEPAKKEKAKKEKVQAPDTTPETNE